MSKRKGAIRDFSGWAFEESSREKDMDRAREFLLRFKAAALNSFLDLLELPRGSVETALKA